MRRQQRLFRDERDLYRVRFQLGEPVERRQGKLDAAGATADHCEAQLRHLRRTFEQGLPALGETGNRLDRDRVLCDAGNLIRTRRRADID